jgi:hypothetical protein
MPYTIGPTTKALEYLTKVRIFTSHTPLPQVSVVSPIYIEPPSRLQSLETLEVLGLRSSFSMILEGGCSGIVFSIKRRWENLGPCSCYLLASAL